MTSPCAHIKFQARALIGASLTRIAAPPPPPGAAAITSCAHMASRRVTTKSSNSQREKAPAGTGASIHTGVQAHAVLQT